MTEKKEKKKKRPMSLKTRIVLIVLAAVAVFAVCYLCWYLVRFRLYKGYTKYLADYEYEQGTEISFKNEASPSVPGFKLVCENEYLKLYTDPATTYIAVYDKRNGEITYSNPIDADNDKKANAVNKNYLKSAMLIYYYNDMVSSNYMDSYSKCVALKQFSYEGITNGIRYLYTIGNTKPIVDKTTKVETENIYFEVPLEYRLDGDSVVVSIPAKGIKEHGKGYIYRIHLHRSFAAAGLEDEGYLVVPNGSGSLIDFNNGKTGVSMYSQYIYDIDPMVSTYTTLEYTKAARLPIFGFCYRNKTILAEVEGGATVASINAMVSGNTNSYNFAFPMFNIRNTDNLVMFGNADRDTYIMEEDFYDLNYTVRYHFLDDDHEGYVGIAKYYREKLENSGKLTKQTASGSDIPFYYDIISGVKETGHILGVQYLHTFSMTSFDQAGDIAKDLSTNGITNQVMNLQGWFNGGYYHDAPHDIRILGKLGGKSGLEKLNDTLSNIGGKLYADVAFQKVSFADKHFNYNFESSRYYGGGYVAAFGQLNPATLRNTASLGYSETRYNLLSPKFLRLYVEKFAKKFSKLDVDGVSLRDLGNSLTSDKNRTCIINRDQALNIVIGQFETIDSMNKNVLVDSANAYAFAYSDDIINVPYKDNDFFICDETIPLYQMILHGYVDYSSELLNDENEYHNDSLVLYLIETGSAPHFNFTWKESSEMKETGLNRFYSTTYSVMKDNAVGIYKTVNEALKNVNGAQITDHQINGDVREITYSNGKKIYVNYGDTEGTINGVTVPAKSYKVEG